VETAKLEQMRMEVAAERAAAMPDEDPKLIPGLPDPSGGGSSAVTAASSP
jgi:hypothetical protein